MTEAIKPYANDFRTQETHHEFLGSGSPGALVEQGEAFMALEGRRMGAREENDRHADNSTEPRATEHFDVVVIGAGQAGLSTGYHLAKRGVNFVILEAGKRIGDTWRNRWDSLRLFTPARFDALDGMPFPARGEHFPTKDEMADYLESYAANFSLPVRLNTKVDRLTRDGGRFVISTGNKAMTADQVIVAAASYQKPKIPAFAKDIDSEIVQIHSSAYRNPKQLREGDVLLVGAGNSGAEIAMDLAARHKIWLSGRDVGHIPFRIGGFLGRKVLVRIVLRGLFHRILTVGTPVGRKVRPHFLAHGGPLIRQHPSDLRKAGVERVARVAGARNGLPCLEDGRTLNIANIVWCTGFYPGLSWIDLPIFDENGRPRHDCGMVPDQPGLYFVGLHFLYSVTSTMIHGVGRDARRITDQTIERMSTLKAA